MRKNEAKYIEQVVKLKCEIRDIDKMIEKYERHKKKLLKKLDEWIKGG